VLGLLRMLIDFQKDYTSLWTEGFIKKAHLLLPLTQLKGGTFKKTKTEK
jgi:hypothetical protein